MGNRLVWRSLLTFELLGRHPAQLSRKIEAPFHISTITLNSYPHCHHGSHVSISFLAGLGLIYSRYHLFYCFSSLNTQCLQKIDIHQQENKTEDSIQWNELFTSVLNPIFFIRDLTLLWPNQGLHQKVSRTQGFFLIFADLNAFHRDRWELFHLENLQSLQDSRQWTLIMILLSRVSTNQLDMTIVNIIIKSQIIGCGGVLDILSPNIL